MDIIQNLVISSLQSQINNINSNLANPIAIGTDAGTTAQSSNAVAIGTDAGNNTQFAGAVAIGWSAGSISQHDYAIGIGANAGNNSQSSDAIAIGHNAGNSTQSSNAIAIGNTAGNNNQNSNSIAIGVYAGESNQFQNSVAIGYFAGQTSQKQYSVAIGNNAGIFNQGSYAIAIGYQAGQSNQAPKSIVINADSTALQNSNVEGFFVNPVRPVTFPVGDTNKTRVVYYTTNNELVYDTSASKTFVIDHPINENKYLVHVCLEGPEAGVYYRGKSTITNNDSVKIELPDYLRHIGSNYTINITRINEYV